MSGWLASVAAAADHRLLARMVPAPPLGYGVRQMWCHSGQAYHIPPLSHRCAPSQPVPTVVVLLPKTNRAGQVRRGAASRDGKKGFTVRLSVSHTAAGPPDRHFLAPSLGIFEARFDIFRAADLGGAAGFQKTVSFWHSFTGGGGPRNSWWHWHRSALLVTQGACGQVCLSCLYLSERVGWRSAIASCRRVGRRFVGVAPRSSAVAERPRNRRTPLVKPYPRLLKHKPGPTFDSSGLVGWAGSVVTSRSTAAVETGPRTRLGLGARGL